MPYFSFLLILIAVAVIALVVRGIEVAAETEVTAAAVVAKYQLNQKGYR